MGGRHRRATARYARRPCLRRRLSGDFGAIVAYRKSTGWNPLEPGETAVGPALVFPGDEGNGWPAWRALLPTSRRIRICWAGSSSASGQTLRRSHERAALAADGGGGKRLHHRRPPRRAARGGGHVRDDPRSCSCRADDGRGRRTRGGKSSPPPGSTRSYTTAIRRRGTRARSHYFPGVPMHYRAKWYVERTAPPLLFALGIHGQNLFVDTPMRSWSRNSPRRRSRSIPGSSD